MCVCVFICVETSLPSLGGSPDLTTALFFFRRLFGLPFCRSWRSWSVISPRGTRVPISPCARTFPQLKRGRFNIYFVPICTWEFILIYGTASSASDSFILRCHLDDSVFAIRYFGTSLPALQNTLWERRFLIKVVMATPKVLAVSYLWGGLHHSALKNARGDEPQTFQRHQAPSELPRAPKARIHHTRLVSQGTPSTPHARTALQSFCGQFLSAS